MALRDKPIEIDDDNWYYEEKKGICIVHQVRDRTKIHKQTDQFYIPWPKLLNSVKRKYPKAFK